MVRRRPLGFDVGVRAMLTRFVFASRSGEPILEPEVDLSSFLERQRISDEPSAILNAAEEKKDYDEDDVDTSLAHISSNPSRSAAAASSKKGKVEEIAWDDELDEMTREKKAAEANWGEYAWF